MEQYINNHFREDITLELLSEKSYMNKYYLVHVFKQYKGVSPINYLISKTCGMCEGAVRNDQLSDCANCGIFWFFHHSLTFLRYLKRQQICRLMSIVNVMIREVSPLFICLILSHLLLLKYYFDNY